MGENRGEGQAFSRFYTRIHSHSTTRFGLKITKCDVQNSDSVVYDVLGSTGSGKLRGSYTAYREGAIGSTSSQAVRIFRVNGVREAEGATGSIGSRSYRLLQGQPWSPVVRTVRTYHFKKL